MAEKFADSMARADWNPLASSWWPVHGRAVAVEAWCPYGEQCEVGRSQCEEDDGRHT